MFEYYKKLLLTFLRCVLSQKLLGGDPSRLMYFRRRFFTNNIFVDSIPRCGIVVKKCNQISFNLSVASNGRVT